MNKPPLACRIIKPFEYVSSEHTDVAKTIKRVRESLKAKAKPTNVRPLTRKEKKAA